MKFTESHEWIALSGKIGTVGVTEYAQKELGEIVYIELPEVGKKVSSGQEIAVLESTKAAADVYTPVSGHILEVNQELKEDASLINVSPQDKGWLYKIELSKPEEYEALLDQERYLSLLH